MARALLSLVVQNASGDILPAARVTVYETDGVTRLAQPLYSAATGSGTRTNPLVADAFGRVVAYCDTAQRAVAAIGNASVVLDIADDPADLATGGVTEGPPGPAGPAGPPGATGPAGPTGPAGADGLANPMTTPNDIIIGGASGAPTRMVKGANSTYLRVSSGGALEYGALPVDPGFANPMTTVSDIIVGGASGTPTRAAKGANSTVLAVDAAGALGYSTVTSAMIADLSIVNGDIASAAGVVVSKLAAGGTANRVVATADGTTMAMSQIASAMLAANSVTQTAWAAGATGNPTTIAAAYADVTDLVTTLTTTGGDLFVVSIGAYKHSVAGGAIVLALSLDGAAEVGAFSIVHAAVASQIMQICMYRWTPVSAASHTVKTRWLTAPATATANGTDRYQWMLELKR